MHTLVCPRCQNSFFTAVTGHDINCPFCDFTIKFVESDLRHMKRVVIERDCEIAKNDYKATCHTRDISRGGVGITLKGIIPFDFGERDTLRIVIKDFEIDSDAEVQWIKRYNGFMSKAGLRFC
jgi:c-di-GMP-binding flagellar brake protein YcgR